VTTAPAREGFQVKVEGNSPPLSEVRPFPKPSIVGCVVAEGPLQSQNQLSMVRYFVTGDAPPERSWGRTTSSPSRGPSPRPALGPTALAGLHQSGIRSEPDAALERIPFHWNRNSLQLSFSGRIFCGEPVPTSPENALARTICTAGDPSGVKVAIFSCPQAHEGILLYFDSEERL
jgi:hypothetical protein